MNGSQGKGIWLICDIVICGYIASWATFKDRAKFLKKKSMTKRFNCLSASVWPLQRHIEFLTIHVWSKLLVVDCFASPLELNIFIIHEKLLLHLMTSILVNLYHILFVDDNSLIAHSPSFSTLTQGFVQRNVKVVESIFLLFQMAPAPV